VAVLAALSSPTELAGDYFAPRRQLRQRLIDRGHRQAPSHRQVCGDKRDVRARPPPCQRFERSRSRSEKRFRQSHWQARPQSPAIPAGVFGRDPPRLAGRAHNDGPPLAFKGAQPFLRDAAGSRFCVSEVAETYQQVVSLVWIARKTLRQQALELDLDRGDCLWVQELAQILAAQ